MAETSALGRTDHNSSGSARPRTRCLRLIGKATRWRIKDGYAKERRVSRGSERKCMDA